MLKLALKLPASVLALAAAALGCGTPKSESAPPHESSKHAAHWSYEGSTGPAHWGSLKPEFALCSTGKKQSPIDITDPTTQDVPDLVFSYRPTAVEIVNNGHTLQVNYDPGSSIQVDGITFALVQFHFHAPSEHTIDGKHARAEMHLVHKSETGALAVVGVLLEEGAHNAKFDPVWSILPRKSGPPMKHDAKVNAIDLLPSDRRTLRYDGSLTTPPGTEGVRWNLMLEPVKLSKAQLDAFTGIFKGNNRPVQSLNGRQVIQDSVAK